MDEGVFPRTVVVAFPIAFLGWVSAGNEIDVVVNDEIRGVASEIADILAGPSSPVGLIVSETKQASNS